VLEREAAPTNIAGERVLPRVRSHVTPQVLGRQEAAHAECTCHLVPTKTDLSESHAQHQKAKLATSITVQTVSFLQDNFQF
jgi:hypothetical protein